MLCKYASKMIAEFLTTSNYVILHFPRKKKDICKYVKIEIIGFHEDSS